MRTKKTRSPANMRMKWTNSWVALSVNRIEEKTHNPANMSKSRPGVTVLIIALVTPMLRQLKTCRPANIQKTRNPANMPKSRPGVTVLIITLVIPMLRQLKTCRPANIPRHRLGVTILIVALVNQTVLRQLPTVLAMEGHCSPMTGGRNMPVL
jgi:hypothetical protein